VQTAGGVIYIQFHGRSMIGEIADPSELTCGLNEDRSGISPMRRMVP
jgi:hypothetical protein